MKSWKFDFETTSRFKRFILNCVHVLDLWKTTEFSDREKKKFSATVLPLVWQYGGKAFMFYLGV